MSTLYTFWDAAIPYGTEHVHFVGAYAACKETEQRNDDKINAGSVGIVTSSLDPPKLESNTQV